MSGTLALFVYKSNLLSKLTVAKITPQFETLEDVLNDPSAKMGIIGGSALVDVFKNAEKNTIYRKLYPNISITLWRGLV